MKLKLLAQARKTKSEQNKININFKKKGKIMAIAIPEGLSSSLVTTITENFTAGLTFVTPILVAVVGISVIRKVINRGKKGRV